MPDLDQPSGQIIVTGASRGIGAAIAAELTRHGFGVVGLSRSGASASGRGVACDVTDEAALRQAIERVAQDGPIAGLVNNAGLHATARSDALATSELESMLRMNAVMPFVACREAFAHLKASGGLIVNIGSFFDKLGVPDNLAYCASKAAVGAMTRCLAAEWARHGIRVLNVAPGYIETDLNREFLADERTAAWLRRRVPVGRPGTTAEVAGLVGMLFREPNGFMTGETLYIDGGQGMYH